MVHARALGPSRTDRRQVNILPPRAQAGFGVKSSSAPRAARDRPGAVFLASRWAFPQGPRFRWKNEPRRVLRAKILAVLEHLHRLWSSTHVAKHGPKLAQLGALVCHMLDSSIDRTNGRKHIILSVGGLGHCLTSVLGNVGTNLTMPDICQTSFEGPFCVNVPAIGARARFQDGNIAQHGATELFIRSRSTPGETGGTPGAAVDLVFTSCDSLACLRRPPVPFPCGSSAASAGTDLAEVFRV